MTDQPRYLLVKRGLYYRPDNHGYTGIKDHAGRYRANEADELSGVTAIHEDNAPEFSEACFDDLARDHLLKKLAIAEQERDNLVEALTPSAATKAAYIGEFSFSWSTLDEYGDERVVKLTVPWATTKEIMAAALQRARHP